MHFTGVLGTSACAGVYVTQVWVYTNVQSANTLAAGCAHMCICIYVCVCVHMQRSASVHIYIPAKKWGDTEIAERGRPVLVMRARYRSAELTPHQRGWTDAD